MKAEVRPLGMTIGSIRSAFPKMMADLFKDKEIKYTFDQMVVLLIVRFCQKTSPVQQDIAEIMNKNKSVVLRMIDVLEQDGLLMRSTDPNDRRRNIITLTKKGYEYTELTIACDHEVTVNLMEGLNESDVKTFFKVFDHIQSKMGVK
ncbi:MarR family winged helix-turn-helix transcriptional regulator [Plebeiibacterium sediminum]|uniref:MarR family transcriptional regulator n=1 Tax=Plebeiibacterium sediminum TaxID=2992112 RepID=A0AAE3M313_9BACT|nr:MarR family transcriptional regulator [Plebeiobacterium sediminum]MCW3785870.1 MarR family transcriptional regulator [Plebeiobacterium sediminum]